MTRIDWDVAGERVFESGVDRGVLFVPGLDGVPWNGLTAVQENPAGGASTPYYYDGEKYLNLSSPEEYAATISAFTYPDEFEVCDGVAEVDFGLSILHQPRQSFSFSYRTKVGNDIAGQDFAYKIHFIWGALATPSTRDNKSRSESVDITDFSWNITLLPPPVTGFKASGHVVLDTRVANPGAITAIEAILYGDDDNPSRMPSLDDLITAVEDALTVHVTDLTGGLYTISGPDADVTDNGDDTFTINWPSVVEVDTDIYSISSL